MSRIMAIDYGRKRTGIAVTDPLRIIATGLTTVQSGKMFEFLSEYFTKEDVTVIVVGHAKQVNNTNSESMRYIIPFVNRLKKLHKDKEVVMYDERFTSKIAFQTMIDGGLRKKSRQNKELVDEISATILLQSYMQSIS